MMLFRLSCIRNRDRRSLSTTAFTPEFRTQNRSPPFANVDFAAGGSVRATLPTMDVIFGDKGGGCGGIEDQFTALKPFPK